MRPFRHAAGVFQQIHQALMGVPIDFSALRPDAWPHDVIDVARHVWSERAQTEYRSIQIMTRFLTEVLGAGDPLEVYAGAAEAITDEIRHTALCVGVVEALGGRPALPDPLIETEVPGFLALSMPERALGTALSMLAISETLSTAFIEDLQQRCHQPVIRAVLDHTLADEQTHHAFGWQYIEASLARFGGAAHAFGRMVAEVTLVPHEARLHQALEHMPPHLRHLDAWPEPELAELGLTSTERQALVYQRVYRDVLEPKLRALGLR